MYRPRKVLRNLWVSAWYLFAITVVLLATTFSAIRLLLPYASNYQAELSAQVSQQIGRPVQIDTLDAEWRGWTPSLVLNGISLLDPETRQAVFRLDRTRLGLDILGSMIHLQPVFSRITLVGVDFLINRDKDGRILLAGLKGQEGGSTNLNSLAGWVLSQGRISLEDSDISWRDEAEPERTVQFSAVNLSLRNAGERHLLDASVTLPGNLGDLLTLHVDMQGDMLDTNSIEANAYIQAERVKLRELFDTHVVANVAVGMEEAGFRIWGKWKAGQLEQLQGDIAAQGVSLDPVQNPSTQIKKLNLSRAAGNFFWQREEQGWRLDADEAVLTRVGVAPKPARISLQFSSAEYQAPAIKARTSYFELENVARLLSLFAVGGEKLQTAMGTLAPRGNVFAAQLEWQGGEAPVYQAYARLQDAGVNAWRIVPTANNVAGQLWLNNRGGQIQLDNSALSLEYPKIFRAPIAVDKLRGQLAWELDGNFWRLSGRNLDASNQDISASAILDVVHDDVNRSPYLSLIANFQEGDGSQIARYLPARVMKEKAVNWLEQGIVAGRVVSGGAIFNGRVREFPFDQGNGRFEVRFNVQDGRLNYAKGWPVIKNIDAEVQFTGRGMSVNARRGNIFSNQIEWATVNIPNMTVKPMLLSVKGEVRGNTQEKVDYLKASPPLSKTFGRYMEKLTAKGDSLLHLGLELPIGKKNAAVVNGWVEMQNNALSIEPLGQVLSDVEGRLHFTHDGLNADGLKTRILDQPSILTVSTEETTNNRNIYIRTDGAYHAKDLISHFVPALQDHVSGDGRWDVSMVIPVRSKTEAPNVATFRVLTDLQGVTADLPAPLNKRPGEIRNLLLQVEFPRGKPSLMRLGYHDLLDSVFELSDDDQAGIGRGELRLQNGSATLPAKSGLRVVGQLDEFSLDDWRTLLAGKAGQAAEADAVGSPFSIAALDHVQVKVNKLTAYSMQMHELQLQLAPDKKARQINIDSKELKGRIKIPEDLTRFPIEADLERWYLTKLDNTVGTGKTDPRDIPSLNIYADDFRYQDRRFGSVKLETTRQANGMHLQELLLKPDSTTVSLRGDWLVAGVSHRSNLNLQVDSTNLEATLKSLGYVGAINDGKGRIDAELAWPDAIYAVDAGNIQGKVNMDLKDGFLLEVDPGAGRIFGLFSLQMLPRRLSLDFSDVFKKGFGFERIAGNFDVTDGNAYTKNFYMKGPSALVSIEGRVGLVDEDYDQLVTIIPQLSDALPVLGALAVTPQIGAALLFFQKVLKVDLGKATQVQYSITGPWKQPVIEKLKKTTGEPQDNTTR